MYLTTPTPSLGGHLTPGDVPPGPRCFRIPEDLFHRFYAPQDPTVRLITLAGAEFLRLALLDRPPPEPTFRWALISRWPDLPLLIIDPWTRQVIGAEGRKRMYVLQAGGFPFADVVIEVCPDPATHRGLDVVLWHRERMARWNGEFPDPTQCQPMTASRRPGQPDRFPGPEPLES